MELYSAMTMLVLDEDSLILPWDAVSSKFTANDYLRKSRYFLEYGGFLDPKLMHHKRGPGFAVERERREIKRAMSAFISTAQKEPKATKALVIKFIVVQKERINRKEIGSAQLRSCLKPVKLALELNDVELSWKKIMRLIPNGRRISPDREYTLEEIRQLLSMASLHLRVAVLFMASSGMRVGAFDYLNVGHVKRFQIDGRLACGKVLVYAGEGDDEYETLISKEALLAFEEYLKARKSSGEKVTDASPAVVVRSGLNRCSSITIKNSLNKILWKSGLRTEKKRRHEFQIDHGLRKFYDNTAKDFIQEDYVEKLIGHDTGTKEHYDRHIPKPALEQYLRAMPYLSIDEAYRSEAELSKKIEEAQRFKDTELSKIRSEIDHEKLEKLEMKERLSARDEQLQELLDWKETMMKMLGTPKAQRLVGMGAKVDPSLLDISPEELKTSPE